MIYKKPRKKADVASPVFMWITIILVLLITGFWFMRQLRPLYMESQKSRFDIEQIKTAASNACNSATYFKQYNPRVEKGVLTINSTHACINVSGLINCITFFCPISNNLIENLANITFIYIVKEGQDINLYTDKTIGDLRDKYMSNE